jgi:hypothetical protein
MAVLALTGVVPHPTVPRRLMIVCPQTGAGVSTGYELIPIRAVTLPRRLVGCTECGQDHTWRIKDAFAAA